jgi:hypothetical protein
VRNRARTTRSRTLRLRDIPRKSRASPPRTGCRISGKTREPAGDEGEETPVRWVRWSKAARFRGVARRAESGWRQKNSGDAGVAVHHRGSGGPTPRPGGPPRPDGYLPDSRRGRAWKDRCGRARGCGKAAKGPGRRSFGLRPDPGCVGPADKRSTKYPVTIAPPRRMRRCRSHRRSFSSRRPAQRRRRRFPEQNGEKKELSDSSTTCAYESFPCDSRDTVETRRLRRSNRGRG